MSKNVQEEFKMSVSISKEKRNILATYLILEEGGIMIAGTKNEIDDPISNYDIGSLFSLDTNTFEKGMN